MQPGGSRVEDLAPCDYQLFFHLKKFSSGQILKTDQVIK